MKSFSFYFKEASKTSYFLFVKNIKNFFKYYFFIFIGSIFSSSIIFSPLYSMANAKFIKNACDNNHVSLIDTLDDIENPMKFWKGFLFSIILIGLTIVVILPLIISIILNTLIPELGSSFFGVAVFVICLLIVSIYSMAISIFFFSSYYILDEEKEITVKDLFKKSIQISSVPLVKGTFIKILLAFIGILYGGYILLFIPLIMIVLTKNIVVIIIALLIILLIFINYFVFLPWLTMTMNMALYLLYKDAKEYLDPNEKEEIDYENIDYEKVFEELLGD